MLELGTPAPSFRLADFNGKITALEDFADARGLVVAFICNHCPYVQHMRNEFARFAREYQAKGIAVVAICSNDTTAYPQDGPEGMAEEARSLLDRQAVAPTDKRPLQLAIDRRLRALAPS